MRRILISMPGPQAVHGACTDAISRLRTSHRGPEEPRFPPMSTGELAICIARFQRLFCASARCLPLTLFGLVALASFVDTLVDLIDHLLADARCAIPCIHPRTMMSLEMRHDVARDEIVATQASRRSS